MASLLKIAETDLALAKYIGGNRITAADIAMIYPMAAAKDRFYLDINYRECNDWLARVQQSEGFKSASTKDGRGSIVLRV